MKISLPISLGVFASYVILIGGGLILFINWITHELRPSYMHLLEENLIESSRQIATLLGQEWSDDNTELLGNLENAYERIYAERFAARISYVKKHIIDSTLYITDTQGQVLFHSRLPEEVGKSYAEWNDVYLTLRGDYGARATRTDISDPSTSVYHVAAPIRDAQGKLVGVLTVAKPVTWATRYLNDTFNHIVTGAILIGLLVLLLGSLITKWLTRPLGRLMRFAEDVSAGKKVPLPRLGEASEIRKMGISIERMRDTLEGRRYVEQYVQTLTHELKSPLAGIRGAAELLQEDVPPEQQKRFAENIQAEAERLNTYVEKMLSLTSVELQKELQNVSRIDMGELCQMVVDHSQFALARKSLDVQLHTNKGCWVEGERLLLEKAVQNLIQNAVEFSPEKGAILIDAYTKKQEVHLVLSDEGPGVPEFAEEKVFERFYSLPRPDNGKKSTGLGLAFVREIVHLHKGEIMLKNKTEKGCAVHVRLPLKGTNS